MEETTRKLTLEIETDGDELRPLTSTIMADGMDSEHAVTLILMAVEGVIRASIMDTVREAAPLLNEELLDEMCLMNAKLAMIDEIMHMQMPPTRGISTTLPA